MIIKTSKFVLLCLLFVLVFGLFSARVWDPDFWWHLKTGEYIWQTGSLPEIDPFAFTSLAKDPLNPESKRITFILKQYWLSQLFIYSVYKYYGFQGIIFMRAFLLTLLAFLLYRAIRREGMEFFSSVLLVSPAAVFVLFAFSGERPQLFSFLFSFLIIFLLEGYRRSVRSKASPHAEAALNAPGFIRGLPPARPLYYLVPLPFIMLLWANIHGGYIVGILIIAGYLVSETVKYFFKGLGPVLPPGPFKLLLAAGTLSILLSFVNPNGFSVFPVLLEFEGSKYGQSVAEARSPFEYMSEGTYTPEINVYIVLTILCFLLMVLNLKRLDITDAVIAAGLAVMSASASRALPFSVIFSSFMVARYGIMTWRRYAPVDKIAAIGSRMKNGFRTSDLLQILAVLLLAALAGYLYLSDKDRFFQKGVAWERYPNGASDFLKSHKMYGNMLNPYVWGGYLIWALYPDYKVFVDGRGLIEEVVMQAGKMRGGHMRKLFGQPEWKAYVEAYNISFIITDSVADTSGNVIRLVPELINDPEWHLIFIDTKSLIFAKDKPENRELIEKYRMPNEWAWTEVISEASTAIRSGNRNIRFYITLGDAFLAMKNYRNAQTIYLKALERDPGNELIKKKLEMINLVISRGQ